MPASDFERLPSSNYITAEYHSIQRPKAVESNLKLPARNLSPQPSTTMTPGSDLGIPSPRQIFTRLSVSRVASHASRNSRNVGQSKISPFGN